jgi:hypothetical protein
LEKIKFFLVSRRALGLAVLSLFVIGVQATARVSVIVATAGTPTFIPTDFHLFAAPIGTAASGYAEFFQTLQAILPPPNHLFDPATGLGLGAPHPGPFGQEIGQGVAANGFIESTAFTTTDFSNGTGVFLAFMIIPGPGSPVGWIAALSVALAAMKASIRSSRLRLPFVLYFLAPRPQHFVFVANRDVLHPLRLRRRSYLSYGTDFLT